METMSAIKPTKHKPYTKSNNLTEGDVTGLVGFASDKLSGTVALSFPKDTAFKIYETMIGTPVNEINTEVQDIVGELTNIVAGGAKTKLSAMGLSYDIAIPIVIAENKHTINHKFDKSVVIVPFNIGNKSFTSKLSIRFNNNSILPS